MRAETFRAAWLAIAGAALATLLATPPARAATYYQHRLAFDYDCLSYDSNPGDFTWDPDDWAQSADEIPGNKGTPDNGPPVAITVNDPLHGLTNIPFTVGPTTDGYNNCMLLYGQTVPVVPGKYLAVTLLYDVDCGPATEPVIAHYTDGSVTQQLTFQDWCHKQSTDFYAWKVDHAQDKTRVDPTTQCGVDYKYIPLNPNRTLQSITIGADPLVHAPGDKVTGGEEGVLFALTLVSNDASLPAYGTISGTVTDMGGGADPTADVFIPELGLKARGDQTKGNYSITVPAGTYHLAAIKEGDPAPNTLPISVTVAAGQTVNQNMVLGASMPNAFAELKGVVNDQSGAPLTGAMVTVLSSQGTPIQTAITDAKGGFDLKGLVPGAVSISADDLLASAAITQPVTLMGGSGNSLTLTLSQAPYLDLSSARLPMGVSWDLQSMGTGATVDPTNYGPADPNYKEDNTWMKNETVPGDASMDVGGGGWFWYRLSGLTLPASLQALAGKNAPLRLKRFEIAGSPHVDANAKDLTFFNGHLIGSTSNSGDNVEPNTFRSYIVDPAFVNWTGANTLALLVYTSGVPAGLTATGPILAPLRNDQALIAGTILDAATGQPATQPTPVALTVPGAVAPFLTIQGTGSFHFPIVAPGSYTVSVPASATVAQGSSASVMAVGGVETSTSLSVQFPAFFESTAADPHDDPFTGATLDSKWMDQDIGMPGAAGKAVLGQGHLEIDGDGNGFSLGGATGTPDNVNFLSQSISGDFAATVQLLSAPDTAPGAMAGLMVRESTMPADPYTAAVATGNMTLATPFRLGAFSESKGLDGVTPGMAPVWLKIRKVGGEVATYWSADGKTANLMAVEETEIPPAALVGLVVTSAQDGTLAAGTFASFKLVPLPVAPAVVCGNLTGSGHVGVADATLALRIAVDLATATPAQQEAACGHAINVAFATQVLRAAVGLIASIPSG